MPKAAITSLKTVEIGAPSTLERFVEQEHLQQFFVLVLSAQNRLQSLSLPNLQMDTDSLKSLIYNVLTSSQVRSNYCVETQLRRLDLSGNLQIDPLSPEEVQTLRDALECLESLEYLNLEGIQINNMVVSSKFQSAFEVKDFVNEMFDHGVRDDGEMVDGLKTPTNEKDIRLSEQEIQLQNRIKQLQQEIQHAKSANRVTESPGKLSKQQSF